MFTTTTESEARVVGPVNALRSRAPAHSGTGRAASNCRGRCQPRHAITWPLAFADTGCSRSAVVPNGIFLHQAVDNSSSECGALARLKWSERPVARARDVIGDHGLRLLPLHDSLRTELFAGARSIKAVAAQHGGNTVGPRAGFA